MWRCLLPASSVTVMALSIPFAAAGPLPAQSPPSSSAAEQQEQSLTISGAVALERQISDLQGLAEMVKRQLGQRRTQQAVGISGSRERQAYRSNKRHRTGSNRTENFTANFKRLIPKLRQQLRLEEQNPSPSDAAEQQQRRQSSLDAFRNVLADLQGEDSELQGLIAQDKEELKQRDVQSSPGSDLAEQQPARDADSPQADELGSQQRDETPPGSRRRVTQSNIRLPIYGARLSICSNGTTKPLPRARIAPSA